MKKNDKILFIYIIKWEIKMNELKEALTKYCQNNSIDLGDLQFKNKEEMNNYLGRENNSDDFLGGLVYEGSDLYSIFNFLDNMGDFSYAQKHLTSIDKLFSELGLWYEPYDSVCLSVYKL